MKTNVGTGEDVAISELADIIKNAVGYQGRLEYDSCKPDGTPRKLLDSGRLRSLGWRPRVTLTDGVAEAYKHFVATLEASDSGRIRGQHPASASR